MITPTEATAIKYAIAAWCAIATELSTRAFASRYVGTHRTGGRR